MARSGTWAVLFSFWILVMVGLAVGAAVGYEAESAEQAVVEFDGEVLVLGNEAHELDFEDLNSVHDNELAPIHTEEQFGGALGAFAPPDSATLDSIIAGMIDQLQADGSNGYLESRLIAFSKTVYYITTGVAGMTAPFFYRISAFVPANVAVIGLALIATAPLGAYMRSIWRDLGELRS